MIHKIQLLKSIGKFRDYQASGNVAFQKVTLVFADNGSGKTTLTNVFRSLTEGDVSIITKRISTNATQGQAAQIIQRNTGIDIQHTFRTTGWSNPFPNIEIFDTHFVNENIYSGFHFTDDHNKQLYQFVIGAQGVTLQQQIEQNKKDKVASRQYLSKLEQHLLQQVGNELRQESLTEFLKISALPSDIDQQIIDAESAFASAGANSVIQTLQPLVQLSLIAQGLNFRNVIADLQLSSQSIQDATLEKLFSQHCSALKSNSVAAPEPWLKTGSEYVKSKSALNDSPLGCPFCKQNIDINADIFKAYAQHFNEEFNNLIKRLAVHSQALIGFNLEAIFQSLNNSITNNVLRTTSWGTHLPNTVQPPNISISTIEAKIRGDLSKSISTVQQKIQNPSFAVDGSSLISLESSLQEINDLLTGYNAEVVAYNLVISSFRGGIQPLNQAQANVSDLKRIKKRFDTPIQTLCRELLAEKQKLSALEAAYPGLITQEQTAATIFFSKYCDRINYYLRLFRTAFQINNIAHVAPAGRATYSRIGYQLKIEGQPISFDHTQQHNAKDCLSEGDKSTLALAFFLAKLDIDPAKADKVVVFDDPLSSFDRNRRMYTVQLLNDLSQQVKQVVILSHNEHFLYELSKGIAAGDKKTLRISESYSTRSSTIEELSLDTLVEIDYFKHVKELEAFLSRADIAKKDDVLGLMRNVLEAHIRFKFYRQTSSLPTNNQTLGTLVTTVDTSGVAFRDPNRTDVVNKLRLINGVSSKPHHGEPTPDYLQLGLDPKTMSVTELAGLVQDTLDLVDTRL
jgi:wobble nucleotide-excising tRNase